MSKVRSRPPSPDWSRPGLTNEELFLFKKLITEAIGSGNLDHSAGFGHSGAD